MAFAISGLSYQLYQLCVVRTSETFTDARGGWLEYKRPNGKKEPVFGCAPPCEYVNRAMMLQGRYSDSGLICLINTCIIACMCSHRA